MNSYVSQHAVQCPAKEIWNTSNLDTPTPSTKLDDCPHAGATKNCALKFLHHSLSHSESTSTSISLCRWSESQSFNKSSAIHNLAKIMDTNEGSITLVRKQKQTNDRVYVRHVRCGVCVACPWYAVCGWYGTTTS